MASLVGIAFLLSAVLNVSAAPPRGDRIGDIEFFGYSGLDLAAIRSALPVHSGDKYSDSIKDLIRTAVLEGSGKPPTDVAAICCDTDGNRVIFIGLPGSSSEPFRYNPTPNGTERLSNRILNLDEQLDRALEAAVRKGGAGIQEDDSQGYSLTSDPGSRSLELAIREYALHHESELFRVLKESADAHQRAIAAEALGYGEQSAEQIAALVHASRDPDDDVRNNAARALGVLASSNSKFSTRIPATTFIEMINSGIWTDRNKAAFVLLELTRARNPHLLGALRDRALPSLIEMAKWRDTSHAASARILLGRIAGIPEARLNELAFNGPVETILKAVDGNAAR